ncbi:MAG: FtsW/RodA/SpoVE family cell cycle protein, partial [Longicatena sp.]
MKIGLSKTKNPSKFDFLLLAYLVLMAITSLFSIHAAFGLVGSSAGWGYFYKQLMWFIIGFIALSAIIYLGNDAMLDFAKIAYWILMGCLIYL